MEVLGLSSSLLEGAVHELSRLPGVGKKTALRLALFLLKLEEQEVESFGNSIIKMRKEIQYCQNCHNISDTETCRICANPERNTGLVCVVEDIRDVMAIEATHQFKGLYHVLGGKISPMDGIGPNDLTIDSLISKAESGTIGEVILALSTTIEGDTTNFYLYKKLKNYPIQISTLARGVGIGDELEYTDEVTLGQSILHRKLFDDSLNS